MITFLHYNLFVFNKKYTKLNYAKKRNKRKDGLTKKNT